MAAGSRRAPGLRPAPGIGRAVALQQGRVVEAVIRLEDAPQVRAWAFYQQPARLDPGAAIKTAPLVAGSTPLR